MVALLSALSDLVNFINLNSSIISKIIGDNYLIPKPKRGKSIKYY